jgi:hypothetical protein
MYEFRNVQDRTWPRRRSRAMRPKQATAHFNKLECFCFNEYTLAPGESGSGRCVSSSTRSCRKDVTHDHAVVHLLRGARARAWPAPRRAQGAHCEQRPRGSILRTFTAVAWSFFGRAQVERATRRTSSS